MFASGKVSTWVFLVLIWAASPVFGDEYSSIVDSLNSPSPEDGVVRGPDGHYFTRSDAPFGTSGKQSILRRGPGGEIESPSWASTEHDESDPYFSPGLDRVCFVSDRSDPQDPHAGDADIWCSDLSGGQWQTPARVPEPVNSPGREYSPVLTAAGDLYFASDRAGGVGLGDLYRATYSQETGWEVANLGPSVNGPGGEWNLELSPKGDILLFEASHRAENLSVSGDLYLSRRESDGWGAPIPLSRLNTPGSELVPRFLTDDELIYSTSSGGDTHLRLVSTREFMPTEPRLLAVSRSAHELVIIGPDSLSIIERRAAGSGPHEVAATADGRVYIVPSHGVFPEPHEQAIEPKDMSWEEGDSTGFLVGDLSGPEAARYGIENCERPHGVAITAQGVRAWLTCEDAGEIVEIDPGSGKELRRLHVGKGVHKVMHLAASDLLFASNPERGEVYLISLDDGSVTTIETGGGAEALAASPDERTAWVANAFAKSLCRIDIEASRVDGCWPTAGTFPIALAVDTALDVIWVARSFSADVAAFSLTDLRVVREIDLPSNPLGMALDRRGGRLFLTLPRLNQIIVLDTASGAEIARIEGIMEADDLDFVPASAFDSPPDT